MSFDKSRSAMRMSLEGVGALELYLVAIAHNMGAMSEQAALLRVALAEREALLGRCAADRSAETDGQK
jgi:hypothetical protein